MTERFVKSATTGVPVVRSQSELERILRRYGAGALAVSNDYEAGEVAVTFRIPDRPGEPATLPVRLKASTFGVYDALFGQPKKRVFHDDGLPTWERDPKGYDPNKMGQAERVAWRHLVLWVDAACTAVGAGLQSMREAFFAHTLVRDESGRIGRLADYVATLESSGQLLLPSGKEGDSGA